MSEDTINPAKNLATMKPEFKKDCLALILQDHRLAKVAVGNLPDDFFEADVDFNLIWLALKEFIVEYGHSPRKHEIADYINDYCVSYSVDDDRKKAMFMALDEVWTHTGFTATRVKGKLFDGIRTHQVLQVTRQIPEYVNDGDWDGLVSAMSQAKNCVSMDAPVTEYWSDTNKRADRRDKESVQPIPTGLLPLDHLMNGGLPRGMLGMLMAGSGHGKSALLAQMALHASRQGFTTGFISLELNADHIMARLDANVSDIGLDFLGTKRSRVIKGIHEEFTKVTPGHLYVQYYPTKSISLYNIEEYIERLYEEFGHALDVLFVDYFDLLRMVGTYEKKYEALEENCEMLRGLAGKFDLSMWTASQINRSGLKEENVGMEHIAAGYGKVFPLDFLATISATEQERTQNVFRLHIAKTRIGPVEENVWIRPNFPKMRFTALTAKEAEAEGLLSAPKGKKSRKSEGKTASFGTMAT